MLLFLNPALGPFFHALPFFFHLPPMDLFIFQPTRHSSSPAPTNLSVSPDSRTFSLLWCPPILPPSSLGKVQRKCGRAFLLRPRVFSSRWNVRPPAKTDSSFRQRRQAAVRVHKFFFLSLRAGFLLGFPANSAIGGCFQFPTGDWYSRRFLFLVI